MTRPIAFIIPGKPCTQGSKDQFGRETNKRLPGWRSDAREAARHVLPTTWDPSRSMRVQAAAYFQRPASHYGRRNGGPYLKPDAPRFPGRVGDVDKLARALLDALTHILWNDDDQVVALTITKHYTEPADYPRLAVRVAMLP